MPCDRYSPKESIRHRSGAALPPPHANECTKLVTLTDKRLGRGMVATRTIPARHAVALCYGKRVEAEDFGSTRKNHRAYMVQHSDGHYTDMFFLRGEKTGAVQPWLCGGYFNHQCKHSNCAFFEYANRMLIVTTREIAEGEELTVCYGPNYELSPCLCADCVSSGG